MKKRTIIISSMLLLLLGCKVKRASKTQSKEQAKVEQSVQYKEAEKSQEKTLVFEKKKDSQATKTREQNTNVEIKGKVDQNNPLTFYNVVEGDTIDLLKVTGNADVFFKSNKSILDKTNTNYNESHHNESRDSKKENEGIVSNVVETASEIQNKAVDVVKRDFQIGAYMTFFFWGLAIIVICGLFLWLRKTQWFKKIFKNE